MEKLFEVRGVKDVIANIRKFGEVAFHAAGRGMRQGGEEIVTEGKRITPVKTGALRSTIHATGPDPKGRDLVVTISAGGPAGAEVGGGYVGYAVYVHEDLTAYHPVGQAKFLETPARARRQRVADLMRAAVRSVLH